MNRPEQRTGGFVPKPITCDGITKTRQGWSRDLGGAKSLVSERISRGWALCKAAVMPRRMISPEGLQSMRFAIRLGVARRNRGIK